MKQPLPQQQEQQQEEALLQRLPGLSLLDPSVASQSNVVRQEGFLSLEEIAQVEALMRRVQALRPVPRWDTVYLQCDHAFQHELPALYERIQNLVTRTDRANWGILSALEKRMGEGVNARCVEFHEYGAKARRICGPHIDTGSLFTVDLMLSATADFEGGDFTTDYVSSSSKSSLLAASGKKNEAKEARRHNQIQEFEQGDAIVFVSHKNHSVSNLQSGTRCVLVLEFWEGSTCQGSHRCMNESCGWHYNDDDDSYENDDDIESP
mmetsp:Transcript_20590/g.48850  ORF Transcript_20590/g.48850 Transcript_20590/m.48850 type:complete len:265 (-) Transcript_20590:165-959(-)